MKTLFILRHAKAEPPRPGEADFDRSLAARGRTAAVAMGREFRRLGLAADHIIASPAARVVETLAGVSDGYGARMPVDYRDDLYLASPETLIGAVRGADAAHEMLLIVGHNPGLQLLALQLGSGPLRADIAAKYPTGALVQISLPATGWHDAGTETGRIERFLRPRDLDAAD
ncbi:MAG: histidine phosphatase family protein [Sphingomonas sp.]